MKPSKIALVVTILATVVMVPLVATASAAEPYPISLHQMAMDIQNEVNSHNPAYQSKGEHTSCTYAETKMRDGYRFPCVVRNKLGHVLARVSVTVTEPRGREWTWRYAILHYVSLPKNQVEATYIVTGAPGTTANIVINDLAGSIDKENVTLPFKITEIAGVAASLTASDLSSSPKASISCEITEPSVAPSKMTATGPNAFVSCS